MRSSSALVSPKPFAVAVLLAAALLLLMPAAATLAATPDTELALLVPSDLASTDENGNSVDIDGNTAVSGSWGNFFLTGAAYVFVQSDGAWTQQAKLTASDGVEGDALGESVAISGDTVVVGSIRDGDNGIHSGSVYVFVRTGTGWSEQAKLTASDGVASHQFGDQVAIDGDTIVAGVPNDGDGGAAAGSAYVFVRNDTTWTEQQELHASDAAGGDRFGNYVAISGETIVAGSSFDNHAGSGSGSAYVFTRSGTTWTEQQKITASDAAAGTLFGGYVAIDGESLVVGAYGDQGDTAYPGAAYVFTRSGSTWSEEQKLLASDGLGKDGFGGVVSIEGETALIGAFRDDSGSAYIFTRSGTKWTEQDKLTASDAAGSALFGIFVAMSGENAAIGAPGKDAFTGGAYVFGPQPPPSTDLSIVKTANPSTLDPGEAFTYTITVTVTNNGPNDATSVVVTDTLPNDITFESSSTCTDLGNDIVECTAATLANGAAMQFTFDVTAPSTVGPRSNTASVTGTPADHIASNNSVTLVTIINPLAAVPGVTTWGLGVLALVLGSLVIVARRRLASSTSL